jgi:beta-glucosidase
VARQAVRESLVLLKNQNQLLPLPPKQRVLVAGDGANDMSRQAGGWTLSWQGDRHASRGLPECGNDLGRLEAQVRSGGGRPNWRSMAVTASPDAIVVFGEDPYAEFQGDCPT